MFVFPHPPECLLPQVGTFLLFTDVYRVFPSGSVARNPPTNAGDVGLIPGSGRSLGGGDGNPVKHSCLENPIDRGACWATVHDVTKESDMAEHACMHV